MVSPPIERMFMKIYPLFNEIPNFLLKSKNNFREMYDFQCSKFLIAYLEAFHYFVFCKHQMLELFLQATTLLFNSAILF